MGTAPQPTDEIAAAAEGPVTASGTGRILPNAVYRASADVGSKLVSVAFFIVMARLLGDSAFGVFTFGLSFAAIVTVLAGFGQDAILTREVARDRRRVDRYFVNTLALKLVASLPVLAVAVGALFVLGVSSQTRTVATLISVAVLIELLTQTCFAVFQAYERLGFLPVVIISQRLFTTAVGIAAMVAGAGVEVVAAIYLAGSSIAFVLALWLLFDRVVRPRLRIDSSTWWPLLRVALPVGVASVFQMTLFRVDAAILQIFEPSSIVGQYGAAYRLFESPLFVSWAVAVAAYPVFSRLTDLGELRTVFERSLKLAVGAALPFTVGGALLATPIVTLLYGDEFRPSGRILALLAPTIVLYAFNHVSSVLLLSRNAQRTLALLYAVMAVENIAANFATIPSYGMTAAAVNTTVSEALLFVAMAVVSTRYTGRVRWVRIFAGPLLAGGAAAGLMAAARGFSLALAIVAGLVAYVAVLAAFEWVAFPDDARAVTRLARRAAADA